MSDNSLSRALRRIANGNRLSSLDVPILEDAADALERTPPAVGEASVYDRAPKVPMPLAPDRDSFGRMTPLPDDAVGEAALLAQVQGWTEEDRRRLPPILESAIAEVEAAGGGGMMQPDDASVVSAMGWARGLLKRLSPLPAPPKEDR